MQLKLREGENWKSIYSQGSFTNWVFFNGQFNYIVKIALKKERNFFLIKLKGRMKDTTDWTDK